MNGGPGHLLDRLGHVRRLERRQAELPVNGSGGGIKTGEYVGKERGFVRSRLRSELYDVRFGDGDDQIGGKFVVLSLRRVARLYPPANFVWGSPALRRPAPCGRALQPVRHAWRIA